jgi:hypothetical protein
MRGVFTCPRAAVAFRVAFALADIAAATVIYGWLMR